ncbi:MAG: glycosyltransferase family 4 protein, partial [Candidatus Zipacnadales bacterium]
MPLRIAYYDAFALFEGSGRAMLDLLDHLDRRRFEAVVVTPREGELLRAAAERGYETAVVPATGALTQYNKALLEGGRRALPNLGGSLLRYGLRVSRWLRQNHIDLLHCNQTRAALQAGLAGRLAGVPVIWVVRIQERLPRLAIRWGAWCASAVVSLAPNCLQDFASVKALERKVIEIPLGVDTNRFAPAFGEPSIPDGLGIQPGDRVVLMVGGLHPRKRHDLLIEAAPHIIQRVPQARIVIVGGSFEDLGGAYEAHL